MKTFKIALSVPDRAYPETVISKGNNKEEALNRAIGSHPNSKLAWGTEPVEVHPINYEPIGGLRIARND